MLRPKPNSRKATRGQTSRPLSLPPPIGGWNARDALTGMAPNDALVLDNWIPDVGNVKTRTGYVSWATGLGGFVESLMEYAPMTGANRLFASTPTAIYEVTSQGAVGAAMVSSLTGGRWNHTMFSALGGTYLFAANGTDGIRMFDGTSWSTPSITGTGFLAANIVAVVSYQNRLWLVENNALRVWYLPVGSIAGTAVAFDMGALFKSGGFIMAMGSWSRDGGAGPDDLAVFVSSKGEVMVYSITDPTQTSGVAVQGLFRIAEPIGRRCMMKVGADLGILTSHGFATLSTMLQINVAGDDQAAVTNKITGAFQQAYADAATNFGWQPIEYPKANLVLVNIPLIERSLQQQYVLNVKTGAWCRFTGMSAGCWSLLGNALMWGDNSGTVWKFDQGTTDNGAAIVATVQSAYSIGGPNQQDQGVKRCVLARAYVTGPPGFAPAVQLAFDYDTTIISAPVNLPTYGNAAGEGDGWDVSLWDQAVWGAVSTPGLRWQTVRGSGVAVSAGISVKVNEQATINGIDILFEKGGLL